MKTLLIDIGNSRVKWAYAVGGRLQAPAQAVPLADSDALFAAWHDTYELPPNQVRMVSVIDRPIVNEIEQWIKAQWGLMPERIKTPSSNLAITIAYKNAEQLGADRWLAMVGAQCRGLLPVCVIDCGSAITIDVVDLSGRHHGGLILPGLAAQQTGIAQIAPALPSPDFTRSPPLLAKTPADAVLSGYLHGSAAAIHGLVARIRKETGLPLQAVLTGGDAKQLSAYFSETPLVLPDLVLEGLAAMG